MAQLAKEYYDITPAGHTVVGVYNPLKRVYECHVLCAQSGRKIQLPDEAREGITAAIHAELAADEQLGADDWALQVREMKLRQAEYLKRLVAFAADLAVDGMAGRAASTKQARHFAQSAS